MSHKTPSKPAAWKNTYFWIAGLLFLIGVYGMDFLGSENAIRDPGQKREGGLVWFYFIASVLMLVNGVVSHLQTVRHYEETVGPITRDRNDVDEGRREQSESAVAGETEEHKEVNG